MPLLLLTLCVILVGMANAAYFFAASRIRSEGHTPPRFLMPGDIQRLFRLYRELAPQRGWSLWPAVMFWPLLLCGMAFGVLAFASTDAHDFQDASNVFLSRNMPSAICILLILLTLFQAIWFTRSSIRNVPSDASRNFGAIQYLWHTKSNRENLILAAAGWAIALALVPVAVWSLVR